MLHVQEAHQVSKRNVWAIKLLHRYIQSCRDQDSIRHMVFIEVWLTALILLFLVLLSVIAGSMTQHIKNIPIKVQIKVSRFLTPSVNQRPSIKPADCPSQTVPMLTSVLMLGNRKVAPFTAAPYLSMATSCIPHILSTNRNLGLQKLRHTFSTGKRLYLLRCHH